MYANTTGGDHRRNLVCAVAKVMDDGIGNVTAALKRQALWDNTVVIFSSGALMPPSDTDSIIEQCNWLHRIKILPYTTHTIRRSRQPLR